jgi:hypothetical protein
MAAMASPLSTGGAARAKKTVDLAGGKRVRGSRIRRAAPPAPVKEMTKEEMRERERRIALIGIVSVALAVSGIVWGIGNNWDFSLAGYTIRM